MDFLCALAVLWKVRAAAGTALHPPTMLWLVFLWVPMGILFLGVFLADTTWLGSAPGSDEERFSRLRNSFFTVLLLIPFVNFGHELYRGALGADADLIFPGLIAIGAIIGFFLRTERADTVLAAAMVAVITTYLLTSYGTVSTL